MSSIGKIGDVLPGIEKRSSLLERSYEVKDAAGRGTGLRFREQVIDLDGNGRAEVIAVRRTEDGHYTDSFSLRNDPTLRDGTAISYGGLPAILERNWSSKHDKTILETGEDGVVRAEHHFDYANGQQRNVTFRDTNRDGKVDYYSIATSTGGTSELIDTNFDGTLDTEHAFKNDGTITTRTGLLKDPFYLDEK